MNFQKGRWMVSVLYLGMGGMSLEAAAIAGQETVQQNSQIQDQYKARRGYGNFPLPDYQWKTGEYTSCSAACGPSVQTRDVSCVSSVTGEASEDANCLASSRPVTARACTNYDRCDYGWSVGEWMTDSGSSCSESRTVTCVQDRPSGSDPVVNDNFCVGSDKPAESRTTGNISAPLCESRFDRYGLSSNQSVTCRCAAVDLTALGNMWGADIYTSDSDLCGTAVHAGKITTEGGVIKARHTGHRTGFGGSLRNGVQTHRYLTDWGSYVFDTPTCN